MQKLNGACHGQEKINLKQITTLGITKVTHNDLSTSLTKAISLYFY